MSYIYTLRRKQSVAHPIQQVFAFFSDARNLEALTPSWLKFQILTSGSIAMAPGTKIDYRLRWHGLPLRWTTEIVQWEPPHSFEDIQLSGRHQSWHHIHRFEEITGGTQLTESCTIPCLSVCWAGFAHALSVRRNVNQIFDYRGEKIRTLPGLAISMPGRPSGFGN